MGAPAPGGSAQGQTLPGQVQQAYGNALDQYGNVSNAGNALLSGSLPYAQMAGGLFAQMGGMQPGDIQAGQLSNTDLSPYMNPYTKNVIDSSMGELNRQEGVQQQGIDDAAQRQNAFGGDRMYLQKGVLGGEFGRTKANMLSDLYSKNFLNAQSMGQYDIGNRLGADQANQNMRAQLYGLGAQGLSGIGLQGAATGGQMAATGAQGLGNLAGSGFQMANAANASRTAAAQAQQEQQQQAINQANAEYARMLGIPQEYMQAMFGIGSGMGNFGFTKNNAQTDPGLLSMLSGGTAALGTLAKLPVPG